MSPVYVCDVCPERFPDPRERGEKSSKERLWDHTLDEHPDYLVRGKAEGLSPDAFHALPVGTEGSGS